ncbi:hypothetical protein HYFRA_00004506 [Hymenoscyphus fraxineus]|uniref:Uncharacterized protein n=1 Tax=Hymenoscyphus fraxineus TaxID=746836 RepID=A0A9N9PIL3_9HELO|nr:hypothetical protein HYFRA_00004506 [Hymenoscyphus fraxineus]
MGLQNLFVNKKRLGKRNKLKYAGKKCYSGIVKCSRKNISPLNKRSPIDGKSEKSLLTLLPNNGGSLQRYGPTSLPRTQNKRGPLSSSPHIISQSYISPKKLWYNSSHDSFDFSNTKFVNCTLESCELSNCHLTGCLVTNCKVIDSEFSDSLISWHQLEKHEEWLFENCEFSNCLLENALVKDSELHRSTIELAPTFFTHTVESQYNPNFYIRRSHLQGCTMHACKLSRATVVDSQLLYGCEMEFVTVARCYVGPALVGHSTFIESTASYCQILQTTMQKCLRFENKYNKCKIRDSVPFLRRLPREIRLAIFRYAIDDPPYPYLEDPAIIHHPKLRNLIVALRGDQELYHEALEVRDRWSYFEHRAEHQDFQNGCRWGSDPLSTKSWRSLQRLTLQFSLSKNISQITPGTLPPEIQFIRRPLTLKYLSLEFQDFSPFVRGLFGTIDLLSSLKSLIQISIMFYPKVRNIKTNPSHPYASEDFRNYWDVALDGCMSTQGRHWIPDHLRSLLHALDKFFGVKSYPDGLQGKFGCRWVWQAKKGETLKMTQALGDF